MNVWLGARHANPSSLHASGRAARAAVEQARRQVADLLAARPEEVVFVGSGSEANNAVIAGLISGEASRRSAPPALVVASFEHPSVLAAAERAATQGAEVVRVPPRSDGRVAAADVEAELAGLRARGGAERSVLVALMLANNEIGTLQPVAEVAERCRRHRALLLCDAVQAVGKVPVDVAALGADFVVLGGHKFHGPLGSGALWIRSGIEIEPLLVGGSQERRRRAGTENVPAIVGLGVACALAAEELDDRADHLSRLRRRLERGLLASIEGCTLHCTDTPRLPNTTSVRFHGVRAQELLIRLDLAGFAVSTGSACSSGAVEASPTLLALGLSEEEALATLRISCGLPNTVDEVDALVAALGRESEALRRATARVAS